MRNGRSEIGRYLLSATGAFFKALVTGHLEGGIGSACSFLFKRVCEGLSDSVGGH